MFFNIASTLRSYILHTVQCFKGCIFGKSYLGKILSIQLLIFPALAPPIFIPAFIPKYLYLYICYFLEFLYCIVDTESCARYSAIFFLCVFCFADSLIWASENLAVHPKTTSNLTLDFPQDTI